MPLTDGPPLVAMIEVTKRIETREVLAGVSLEIAEGRLLALLGPNGAGKTTSVRTMTGLVRPDSGRVEVRGELMTGVDADRLRGAFGVQSDGTLYESLTVRDNLAIWGRLYGLGILERERRIAELLELFSLGDRRDTRLSALSKGLRQRVALARAVLSRPSILLLDEPTAGLDPSSVRDLYSFLIELRSTSGIGIMVCTHQLEGIQPICDDIAILDRGVIAAYGPVVDVISCRWPQIEIEIDVAGGPADAVDALTRELPGATITNAGVTGGPVGRLVAAVPNVNAIPVVVRTLVAADVAVLRVAPRERSLEDLYFDVIGEDGK